MGKARQRQRVGRDRPPRRLTRRLLPVGASEFPNARFAKPLGGSLARSIGLLVLETPLGEKTGYCCLADGRLASEGTVWLTAGGQAVREALLRLPAAADPVILRELKLGWIPLHRKILETVAAAPPGTRICFWVRLFSATKDRKPIKG